MEVISEDRFVEFNELVANVTEFGQRRCERLQDEKRMFYFSRCIRDIREKGT